MLEFLRYELNKLNCILDTIEKKLEQKELTGKDLTKDELYNFLYMLIKI